MAVQIVKHTRQSLILLVLPLSESVDKLRMIRDQAGTVHAFDFDKLGRQIHDRVTELGSGVDGAVRRISTSYEVREMRETITSWTSADVSLGDAVNEVQFVYNDFGQLIDGVGQFGDPGALGLLGLWHSAYPRPRL